MTFFVLSAAAACVLAVAAPASAEPQQTFNRCAQCHFANLVDVPGAAHLSEWERSPHARRGVGCERCHGGDATTVHPVEAHRGVLDSRNPASPVNRVNLPETCGTCHDGALQAFRKSRHAALLAHGDAGAPSCSTCHGAMTARVPSPRVLESQCARCHPPAAAGEGYARDAGALLTDVDQIDADLARADWLLAGVRDSARRERLAQARVKAAAALTEVAGAVHAFDLALATRLAGAARAQVNDLLRQLNPPQS